MQISVATEPDMDIVIALWKACDLTRPWNDPATDFRLALANETSAILLAHEGGALVGSVMVGFDGHRGWVYYLAVTPEHQNHGIGRRVMQAAENWLRDHGAPKIQLMVRDDNEVAIRFYEKIGLEKQSVVTLGKKFD